MIYIHHGEKQPIHNNGEGGIFNHDPGLDGECIPNCKKLCKTLIALYGYPVKIVCSPYRVCRETAIILGSVLKNTYSEKQKSNIPDIVVDTSLSYYLGNGKHLNVNVTPQTQFYRPPFHENQEEMKYRVEKHVTAQKKYFSKKNGPIWYITHFNILSEILSIHSSSFCKNISLNVPLFTCCINETNDYNKLDLITLK